ncbi:MAG: sel1 repeat family protein [Oscillospiraceae bacterium]|nr:sel1 repeat family protein [Oscillospiraceae bacterium]
MKPSREMLEKAVKSYKKLTNRNFVLASQLSEKQISNAIKHIDKYIKPKDVVAFLDNTLFGSGKGGILLTTEKIACSDSVTSAAYIDNLAKAEYSGDEVKVYFSGNTFRRIKVKTYAVEVASLLNAVAKEKLLAEKAALEAEAAEIEKEAELLKQKEAEKAKAKPAPEAKPAVKIEEPPKKPEETDEELFARANRLYNSKNYAEAFPIYEKLAGKGMTKAQQYCAEMYYFGTGTEKNPEKAFYLFGKAAEGGDEKGAYDLAVFYNVGEIVEKDKKKAFFWFEKSAGKGYAPAQYVVGKAYVYGEGTEQNYDKAVFWLEKAANQGNEKASKLLRQLKAALAEEEKRKAEEEKASKEDEIFFSSMDGEKLFYYGNGLYNEGKKEDAFDCYIKAAEKGDSYAMCAAAEMLFGGEMGKGREEEAFDLLDKAKSRGEKLADNLEYKFKDIIAEIRRKKESEKIFEAAKFDLENDRCFKAADGFKKAAEAGHAEAMYEYGALLESGRAGRRDIDEAIFWLEKAKENGISKGDDMLSLLRYEKESLRTYKEEKNRPEPARKHEETYPELVKKALAGDTAAMRKCAYRCERGLEGTKTEALFWYLEAAREGDDIGRANLGRLFQFGIGVPVNNFKALEWYEKSCAAKNDCELLGGRLAEGEIEGIPDPEALAEFIEDCSAEGEMFYEVGFGFEDWFRGYMNLSIAAEFDEPLAQYYLGEMFCEDGQYNKKDLEKAKYWLERAEENGNEDAAGMIKNIEKGLFD